ncbi:MAG: peptidylprolyl isomerase [Planctomycetes bacterium]|nr:peptidylprolyl isomerase [Planctomycetota bacterium]
MPSTRFGLIALLACVVTSALVSFVSAPAEAQGVEDRKCRHILVRTEAQIDDLIARIEKGESFAALARVHSFDVVTKKLAGELGWIANANYEPAFMRAAYSIPAVNGIAKCKTSHGWHVIQVTEILNEGGTRPPSARDESATTPPVRPAPTVNKDLEFSLDVGKISHAPGEDIHLTITAKNNSKTPQNVLNPSLWPLGLTVRYQFGKLNVPLTHPESAPEPSGGFSRYLEPGEALTQRFRLQDYTGELENWPIIRLNWRANIFFANLENRFPQVKELDEYANFREQWKFYASQDEQRINILPDYDPTQRWFVMLHTRGRIWAELKDPGIPGLLEYWIGVVRSDFYNKQRYSDFVEDSHFVAGGAAEDGTGMYTPVFELPKGAEPTELAGYSLALEPEKGRAVSSRLYLTLAEPKNVRGIPLGPILSGRGTEVLDNLAKQYLIRGQEPRTMLALVYPYDLLPQDVRAIADGIVPAGANEEETDERRAPSVSKDLPRVQIQTELGAIDVELFEDDSPNSVASFISLVESGFYDGLTFHSRWRREDNRGFVLGGSPDASPTGHAGYYLPDESSPRRHLRGSIALARRASVPNSSSCQFYVCFENQPHFDNVDTVIGHVMNGLDRLEKMPEGTKILSAKVVTKRDHPYDTFRKLPAEEAMKK